MRMRQNCTTHTSHVKQLSTSTMNESRADFWVVAVECHIAKDFTVLNAGNNFKLLAWMRK